MLYDSILRHPAKAKLQGQKTDEWVPGAEGGEGLTKKRQQRKRVDGGMEKLGVSVVVQVTLLGGAREAETWSPPMANYWWPQIEAPSPLFAPH